VIRLRHPGFDADLSMSNRTLLLIDALNIIRRIWEAIPIEDSPEKAVGAMRSCLASFKRAIEHHAPTHALAVFDLEGTTWRHDLYPDYQAGRKPMPESMRTSLPALISNLGELGIPSFSMAGYEADDVLAAIAHAMGQSNQAARHGDLDRQGLDGTHSLRRPGLGSLQG
jgi:DNA polymerase-1